MKDKIKSAGFWISLIGSIFLMLGAFGIEIASETASAVINGVCSFLVMAGIIVPEKHGKEQSDASPEDDDLEE